ncbi:MAG TPA: SemiSWEET transporter [Pyrinomonadaceae bacterium]|jgi:MtN3 and saliva related transmembrane protein|nr:SemiSWEET transporter [Pyrinomonadaceae bacterium]
MEGLTLLGLVAGGLTTVSFVPQVRKIWKTRSAEDVSLMMFVAFCVGVSLWLVYGFMKGEVAIIATNAVTLVLGAAIVWMKLKFK